MRLSKIMFATAMMIGLSSFILLQKQKPVLYIIGDSTVKNGSGTGGQGLWGWGSFIADYFDTTRIGVENHAIGGRSSRTFITEGRWARIVERLKPGDFVIMQFGHNDAGPLDDTARARGTIRGIGNDSAAIYNPIRKINEVVYTYGYYMRKYVDEAKAKGAIPIVCSLVPRDNFREGKTVRSDSTYGGWAQTVAKSNGALYIPLNNLVAERYDQLGPEKVHTFFPVDHTHPDKAGSELTASIVIDAIRKLDKCALKNYLAPEPELPKKKDVLKAMRLTNKYFMNKWPNPGDSIMTNIKRPANIWTRAVYYEGLMALYGLDKKKAYYKYAVDWGVKHNWNLRGGVQTRNADNQCCGQTYIDLYLIDKKEERIKAIKESIDLMKATPKIDDWNWVDAIQMAMPVFVRLGVLYNDTSYFNRMYDMYAFTKYKHGDKGLYNPAEKLWWRDKDFDPPYKEPNGEDCYWSRGNGWVVAALVRVLQMLPKTDPHYNEYLQDLKDMLQALLPIQRPDNFWNPSLHDPNNFGSKELSGTSLFIYGMAWGINNGLIDRATYLPVVIKTWNALVKDCVHPNGMLGFVQGTGKEPKDGQPVTYDHLPDFEDYGLGCFLLAGTEVYKLKKL